MCLFCSNQREYKIAQFPVDPMLTIEHKQNDPSERKLKSYKKDQLMKYLFDDATTSLEALQKGNRQSSNAFFLNKI